MAIDNVILEVPDAVALGFFDMALRQSMIQHFRKL